jgi:hypothetical protein
MNRMGEEREFESVFEVDDYLYLRWMIIFIFTRIV